MEPPLVAEAGLGRTPSRWRSPPPGACGPERLHRTPWPAALQGLGWSARAPMLKFTPSRRIQSMQSFDRELDVRGLNCPLPILRPKKALGVLPAGQGLKARATDPGSCKAFQR